MKPKDNLQIASGFPWRLSFHVAFTIVIFLGSVYSGFYFQVTRGHTVHGCDVYSAYKSLKSCLTWCLQNENCFSVDHRPHDNACWLNEDPRRCYNLIIKPQENFYKLSSDDAKGLNSDNYRIFKDRKLSYVTSGIKQSKMDIESCAALCTTHTRTCLTYVLENAGHANYDCIILNTHDEQTLEQAGGWITAIKEISIIDN